MHYACKPDPVSPASGIRQSCIWDGCYQPPRATLSDKPSTALHRSKDLAVSPACFHAILPEGSSSVSGQASLLAPRGSLQTGITRYPSSGSLLRTVSGLSSGDCSPAIAQRSAVILCHIKQACAKEHSGLRPLCSFCLQLKPARGSRRRRRRMPIPSSHLSRPASRRG
jgi:hypothetical protein